jgi:hypothetical protein
MILPITKAAWVRNRRMHVRSHPLLLLDNLLIEFFSTLYHWVPHQQGALLSARCEIFGEGE